MPIFFASRSTGRTPAMSAQDVNPDEIPACLNLSPDPLTGGKGKVAQDSLVLMVSTSYPQDLSDWRGLFIFQLADALARRREIRLRLWAPPGELPPGVANVASREESVWLKSLMASGGIAHLMRTRPARGLIAAIDLLRSLRAMYRREATADVLHVNWLQNALTLPNDGRPVLIAVLGTDMQLLKLPGMKALLRRVLRNHRCAICPNAEWMVDELHACFGDAAEIRFLPFGIDPFWYTIERKPALPEKWICVARLTKGKIGTLFEWGREYFSNGRRELHLFGPMQQTMTVPDWVNYHGPATPESLSSEWFPIANGLISLSQHAEGRPQVMLEAMAAGLPIIASRIPAHADLLVQGESGWLCGTPEELGKALTDLRNLDRNIEVGRFGREWVSRKIGTWDDCAGRYCDIYAELIHF